MKVPVCEATKRLAILFGRKAFYTWSDKEGKAYLALAKDGFYDDPSDMDLLERYYAFERKKGEGQRGGIHRRDLLTYLTHAHGERDRATLWGQLHPLKKASPDALPWGSEPVWDAEAAAATKGKLAEFRRNMRGPTK